MGLRLRMFVRGVMVIVGLWLRCVLWVTRRSLSKRFVWPAMRLLVFTGLFSTEVWHIHSNLRLCFLLTRWLDGEWQQCIVDDKLYLRAADYDESVDERPIWDD